jgi:c-di-GMP-binding flagellar brake protein YcgR
MEASLVDISVGGVQILIRGELPSIMTKGAVVPGCSIQFPQIGAVPLTLKFCGIWSSTDSKSGQQSHRIGMEFLNLSRGAGNLIQRYLIELEQEHLAKA